MNVLKLIGLAIKLVSIGGTLIVLLKDKHDRKKRKFGGRNGD